MKSEHRARVAVGLDRQGLDQAAVAFLELDALRLRNPMDEMAAVAREEMQLQAGLVVADSAQRLIVDLMLRAEVVSKELEVAVDPP